MCLAECLMLWSRENGLRVTEFCVLAQKLREWEDTVDFGVGQLAIWSALFFTLDTSPMLSMTSEKGNQRVNFCTELIQMHVTSFYCAFRSLLEFCGEIFLEIEKLAIVGNQELVTVVQSELCEKQWKDGALNGTLQLTWALALRSLGQTQATAQSTCFLFHVFIFLV